MQDFSKALAGWLKGLVSLSSPAQMFGLTARLFLSFFSLLIDLCLWPLKKINWLRLLTKFKIF